jgi:cytochrome c2
VAGTEDFVTRIEISRGPEPESHRNANWITLHNQAIDSSCTACHTMEDAGGTSNTSFCSNSACHGSVFTFAGFDAPKLREILQAQIPAPAPTPTAGPPVENPTYEANVGALMTAKCAACHNETTLAGGLDVSTFDALMLGGKDGEVIVPGNPAGSLLMTVQSGQHFANLSAAELEIVQVWIEAGAPEN